MGTIPKLSEIRTDIEEARAWKREQEAAQAAREHEAVAEFRQVFDRYVSPDVQRVLEIDCTLDEYEREEHPLDREPIPIALMEVGQYRALVELKEGSGNTPLWSVEITGPPQAMYEGILDVGSEDLQSFLLSTYEEWVMAERGLAEELDLAAGEFERL
jgi:hypothetical protein